MVEKRSILLYTPPEDMGSSKIKRWFLTLSVSLLLLTSAILALQIAIDPLDVWLSPRLWGINNWKVPPWNNDRITKSYQIQEKGEVEVVLFGTSRANFGYPGYWPGARAGAMYNYGLAGLHIPELAMQVDFVLSTKSPKVVVFALEPLMFSGLNRDPRPGFSKRRLRMIAHSAVARVGYKVKETVFNWTALRYTAEVIRGSWNVRNEVLFDRDGWLRFRGRERHVTEDGYLLNTWTYLTYIYKHLTISRRSVDTFREIVERTRARGVEVVVLMNPLSGDCLLALEANGKRGLLDALKRELVKVTPFWDFAYFNRVTGERRNYLDGAHFNGQVGRYVLDRVGPGAIGVISNFGVRLTEENIHFQLQQQRMAFKRLQTQEAAMLTVMKNGLRHLKKPIFAKQISRIVPFRPTPPSDPGIGATDPFSEERQTPTGNP